MKQTHYISVILPLKLEWTPCYAVPAEMGEPRVGDRVKVMFANRQYIGVVCETGVTPEINPDRILSVLSIEHNLERILPQEIELWKAISDYYLCDMGEVYKAAYPYRKVNLEEARAAAISKVHQRREKFTDSIRLKIEKLEDRLAKKKAMLGKAKKDSTKKTYLKETEKLENEIRLAQNALESLTRRPCSQKDNRSLTDINITLSRAQEAAFKEIHEGFMSHKPILLNGVTGSGKTEIYIKLAYEAMTAGKNVLYLVPEIALSRQLEDRLYEYFGEKLLVFHSGESDASKRNTAEVIRETIQDQMLNDVPEEAENETTEAAGNGIRNYIVLGTRSALFLPHHDLGLIIVDEEHDNSYKQDSPAPRYNGRDTALILSLIQQSDIILGSATPSLEEMYNCKAGRHRLVELKGKFHGTEMPDIEIIDTKAERKKNGMVGNFSRRLIDHIKRTIERGEQVMVLRSRRAWATVMQCGSCGTIVKCPHCSVSMSHHKEGRMICHYCGHTEAFTGTCPKCGGTLASLGAGTQRIEEEAEGLFPDARIARLDSDTARNKTYEAGTIRDFSKGKIDILIGTQIVTKGFDFGKLTLVAVIAADTLLGIQDFRADEKALQLLEQFRGRCGRRDRKGLFIIQTSQPEHPVYQKITSSQTDMLNMDLLQERKEFNFPPYSRIVEISIRDIYEERAERMAWSLCTDLRSRFDKGEGILGSPVTGPYSPAVDKVADKHIRVIRISLKKDRNLTAGKAAIKTIVHEFEKSRKYDGHITINVDPA